MAAVVNGDSDVFDSAYIDGGQCCWLEQGHDLPFVLFGWTKNLLNSARTLHMQI